MNMCNSICIAFFEFSQLPLADKKSKVMKINPKQLELLFDFYRKSIFNYTPSTLPLFPRPEASIKRTAVERKRNIKSLEFVLDN
jgi:hypothetical protein